MSKYQVPPEERLQYAGIYLIEYMVNTPAEFDVFLSENDSDLESILEWLLEKDLAEIFEEKSYRASKKGHALLTRYMKRYSEYLHAFDIFAHTDLGAGEFALQFWPEHRGNANWENLKQEERFEDLRIAIADYLELSPVEVVFMSYINEKRFGRTETGWQFDLLLGSVWDEITEICESAIQWHQLGYNDEQGEVPATEVIEDILWQGLSLVDELDKLGDLPLIKTPHESTELGYLTRVEVPTAFKSFEDQFDEKVAFFKTKWFDL